MNIEDLHHGSAGGNALLSHTVTINTNTTTLGAEIDMQGYNALEVYLLSATITDGAYAVTYQHSDVSGSGFVAAAAEDVVGVADYALADDAAPKRIGYIGKKRYVKLAIVSTAVTIGGVFLGLAVRASAMHQPVADQ